MPNFSVQPVDTVPDFGPPGATGAPKFSVVPVDTAPDFGDAQVTGDTPWAPTRGFVHTLLQDNPGALADALEGASYLLGDQEWAGGLRDTAGRIRAAAQAPAQYAPQSGGLGDLWDNPSIGRALTYLGESFGSGVASTLPSLVGGTTGAVVGGRIAGKPGAAVGAVGGATVPAAGMNYGGMYRALLDEGVKPEAAAKWAGYAALPITALDVAPVAGWAERFAGQGAKQEVQRAFAKRIIQEALKGAAAEGVTEGAQQVIQERVAADVTGKDFWTTERMRNILDNAIGGALAGGAFGGASGVRRDQATPAQQPEPEPVKVEPLPLPAPQQARALPPPERTYGEGFTMREGRPGEGYEPPPTGLPAPPELLRLENGGTPLLPAPERTYGSGFSVVPVDTAPDFGEPRKQFRPPEPELIEDQRTPAQRFFVEPVDVAPDFGNRDVQFEDVVSSIHKQESGGRETAKTSVTGARGGMQIQPATFAQYARPGESIDRPADNIAVGRRIIADLWDKSGGDPARVAVGYFSGPGNIAPAGAATPWKRDAADPTGKTTSSYVEDVLKRLGRGGLPWDVPQDEPQRKGIEFENLPDQTPAPGLAQIEAALLGQQQGQPEDVAAPLREAARGQDEPAAEIPPVPNPNLAAQNIPENIPSGVAGASATKAENQPDLSTGQIHPGTPVRVKLSDGTYAGNGAVGKVTGYVEGKRPRVQLEGFSGLKAPFSDLVTLEPVAESGKASPQGGGASLAQPAQPAQVQPAAPDFQSSIYENLGNAENATPQPQARATWQKENGIPPVERVVEMLREEAPKQGKALPTGSRGNLTAELAERIRQSIKDWKFNEALYPANKVSRAVFEKITGEKLPKTLSGTKAFFETEKNLFGERIPVEDEALRKRGREILDDEMAESRQSLLNNPPGRSVEPITDEQIADETRRRLKHYSRYDAPGYAEAMRRLDAEESESQKGAAHRAERYRQEQQAITKAQPQPPKPHEGTPKHRWIGHNYDNNPVFEDSRGVRSYTENGVRVSESVGIRPTREGGAEIGIDKSNRGDEFKTIDEVDADQKTPTPKPATIEAQTSKEQTSRGLQEPVSGSDEATRAEDVQQPAPERPVAKSPSAEEPGGAPDAGRDTGERTEAPERVSEGPGGAEQGGRASPSEHDRVYAGRGDAAADVGERAAKRPSDRETGENYSIPLGGTKEGRSLKQKARDNLAAVELVKKIEAEDRPATPEEQQKLSLYVGWGGLAGAFHDSTGKFGKGFEEIGAKLRDLLTDEEYRTASRSTQYAHYTAENVVRAMWGAVERMGFKGGKVFEPGMGIGHFLGMMPEELVGATAYSGIELDHFTARIAKLIYPRSGVKQADFTKLPMPKNAYDLVIGNPPFSDAVIRSDPDYAKHGFMLHDYFFAKSLDAVRPGGLMAFITSAGTMNKIDPSAREYLAERADFVGGVRLPSSAFQQSSNTEVTTDILFFRKRPEVETEPRSFETDWTETRNVSLPDADGGMQRGAVNAYFVAHPEMVLGEQGFFDKLYKGRYAVHPRPGQNLNEELNTALRNLSSDVMTEPSSPEDRAHEDFDAPETKDGSFYVKDGKLMQYLDRKGIPVQVSAPAEEKIRGLLPIRDALRDVYSADLAGNDAAAGKARAALNKGYDAFVAKFGPINKATFQYRRPNSRQVTAALEQAREDARERGEEFDESSFSADDLPDIVIEKRPNIEPFMDDQESYRLRSIEDYNDATGESRKKAIFFENVLTKWHEPQVSSANDGILWSLNKLGRFDIDAVADKLGKPRAEVVAELGDAVFRVPGTDTVQTREEYLSGNVREKLRIAKEAAGQDPDIRRNVAALEAVQPTPLPPSQISMSLGMSWIPPKTVEDFVSKRMELGRVGVSFAPVLGQWSVNADRWGQTAASGAATSEWGTEDRGAFQLLEDALNKQWPKIYVREGSGRDAKTVLDPVATQAAADKITKIKEAFEEWVHADGDRSNQLADLYNEKLNNSIDRQYDGSYLTTPGVASAWKWRPHQTRVISRIILTGNTYMAHTVGAGKTSAMIGAGMEMRRLGLVRKPMYVVPNHMLAQFTKEFYEQYPTARIAVADERRFHTDRRKQFIANVAQDDLDAVIITHSSFGKVGISAGFSDGLVREQIDEYAEALNDLDKTQENRITRKRIENAIEKLEQRLSGKGKKQQDSVMTFEQMGVDFLFVDEAHMFRKLDFSTRQNLKGITSEGSKASWDLYSKIRFLESRAPGRSAVLASGTPITNTMGELFTLSRYLQPQALKARSISHFDSWSATFGDTSTRLEPNPAGGHSSVTRFSKFLNVPELYRMVAEVMDIVTGKQLEQYVVRPKLKNGRRENHVVPRTDAIRQYQADLAKRIEAINARRGPPEPGDDIILSVINDGRHSALDMRFVDPSAPNDPNSKLNVMIRNVHRIWRETRNTEFKDPGSNYQKNVGKGPATQMVFANLGVNPRGAAGFSGYAWMRKEFRRLGIPANEVAFVGDFKSHAARQKLFNDVNEGKVRILVGSVQKMGTGVNAQRRLKAIHNEDPLWFPADDEQRNGRMIRQGNQNPEVEVHDYSTEDTYDAAMWSMMARKASFIEGFFSGDPSIREVEDLGEASAYEQAAAMAISDKRVFDLANMREELAKAERRRAAHDSDQYSLRQRIKSAEWDAENAADTLDSVEEDIKKRRDISGKNFSMALDGKSYTKRAEAGTALTDMVRAAVDANEDIKPRRVGEIGGFPVTFSFSMARGARGPSGVFGIERSGKRHSEFTVGESDTGAVASAEAVLRKFEDERAYQKGRIKRAEEIIADLKPRLGASFKGGEEIDRLRKEVRALEKQLDDESKPKQEQEEGPKASLFGPWRSPRDRERIAKRVVDIVRQIAPQTGVETVDDLKVRVGGRDLPGGGQFDPVRNLVTVALNFGDPGVTAGHEAVHALRNAGLFTPQEWATLEKAAKDRWIDELGVRDTYRGVSDDVVTEEAIAQRFAEWRAQPANELPAVRRAFTKMRDFFRRLANALRGMGFRTPEDVFEAAERGEVGRRGQYGSLRPDMGETKPSIFHTKSEATGAAHDLSFRENRGAWVWKDGDGEYHADVAFKPKDGEFVARVFGDEVFPVDETDMVRASLFNTLKRQAAPVLKQPAQKPGTNAQKSAVDRIFGTGHTPFRERVRASIHDYSDRQFLKAKQAILDQFASVKALEREARGDTATGSRSPYKSIRLTRNLHSVMAYVLRHGPIAVGKQQDGGVWFGRLKGWDKGGFEDIFKPIADKGLLDLWRGWAVAVRSEQLAREGREKLISDADRDLFLPLGGRWDEEAGRFYGTSQYPEFQAAFKKWQAFNKAMLDMAEASGLINAEQRTLWERSDYIPFYRTDGENKVIGTSRGKRSVANQRSPVHRLFGGEGKLNDPIENMVMNMTSLVDRSFKNLAARKVVALALEAGAMEREKYDWRKDQVTPEDAARELERIGVQVTGMTPQQHAQMLNFWRMQAPTDPDVISVMVGGKPQFFRVHDPMLLQSLASMTPQQLTGVLGIFRAAKRLLTEAITIDPAFMAANGVRDTLAAYVTTGQKGFKPFVDSMRGFAKALKEDDPIKLDIMANGGGLAGFYGTSPEDARKYIERHVGRLGVESIMDTPRKLWEGWHKIGQASESANRIAIAEAVKKNGGSEAEQAFQGMDLLDFGMRGASATMRILIETIPFLNARVQGLYRLGRGAKENPKAFLLRGSILAAASLALLAENWDNDEYEKLEDWDKDTYWHLWVDGVHLRLPKPFEVGALFGTIPERMARAYFGKDDMRAAWNATKFMLQSTFQIDMPQLFAPLVEQWANKDTFTKRPIVGADLEKLPAWMQYRPDTSETAREAGAALSTVLPQELESLSSPERIEHLVGGYFGTLGTYLLALSDQAVRLAGDYPSDPTLRIDDIPVVKRFVRADPQRNTRFLTEFYELKNEVDKTASAVRELGKRGETDDAEEYIEERAGDLAAAKVLDKAARAMTNLRLSEQSIMRDRQMTPTQKRKAIDEITTDRNAMAEEFVGYAKTLRVMNGIANAP